MAKEQFIRLQDDGGYPTPEGEKVEAALARKVGRYLQDLMSGKALGKPVPRAELLEVWTYRFLTESYNADCAIHNMEAKEYNARKLKKNKKRKT